MKYILDSNLRTPVYQQLYLQIREDIVNGIYPIGSKLPSKRVIALNCDTSLITVEHAYALLIDEGYVEARERSGYFVIFQSVDGFVSVPALNKVRRKHSSYVETNSNFPFSVLAKKMRKVINDEGEKILERSPPFGSFELREAIRAYLAKNRGILVDCEQIVIGSGSEYFYTLLIEFFGRKCIYAIESPSYLKIEQIYKAFNVKLEKLPLTDDGIDSSALKNCMANILHISPYRSYPSGVSATASKRHEYLHWVEKKDRYIIEDDFESEFSVLRKPEETLFSHSPKDNIIYMNTFSKTISPSLRIGYMLLPKPLVKKYKQKFGFFSCTVPTYIQLVVAELIINGDFERHINRVRRLKRKQQI